MPPSDPLTPAGRGAPSRLTGDTQRPSGPRVMVFSAPRAGAVRHGRGGCGSRAAPAQTLLLEVVDLFADVVSIRDHDSDKAAGNCQSMTSHVPHTYQSLTGQTPTYDRATTGLV